MGDPVEIATEALLIDRYGDRSSLPRGTAAPILEAHRAATAVPSAMHEAGWRIVQLGTYSGVEPPYVVEEWTPESAPFPQSNPTPKEQ